MQKGLKTLRNFQKKYKKLLLGCFNGDFAEFLELLHELEGGLAGACAGGLVALSDLCFGIGFEDIHRLLDFLYKLFHGVLCLKIVNG